MGIVFSQPKLLCKNIFLQRETRTMAAFLPFRTELSLIKLLFHVVPVSN